MKTSLPLKVKGYHLVNAIILALCLGSFASVAKVKAPKGHKIPLEDLRRFTTVVEHIKNYHVNTTGDPELLENAIRGMLAGLDPHSAYLSEEEFADLKVSTSGKFGGLGLEVTLEDGFIRVISPIDDTPAATSGIMAGDLIVRLDDTPVKGMSLRESVNIMRGKPGSKIILSILRPGTANPLRIPVKRAIISVQSVKAKMLDKDYAYVRISQFQSNTGDELLSHIKKVKRTNNLKGLILDLRNNPGGVLDASVQVADAFLDKQTLKHDGLIVYTEGRLAGSKIQEKATTGDQLNKLPMVVLVNGGSASASEIVAAALQDHKRAIVLGTKTFGKGSVQSILPLKEKRGLKLTTALYYRPAGYSIQAKGVNPDITVDALEIPKPSEGATETLLIKEAHLQGHIDNSNNPETEQTADSTLAYSDYQLEQALNVLKGLQIMHESSL